MELKASREAREKERDEREWEQNNARESLKAANKIAAQIQAKSKEKLSLFQSQMQLLATIALDTIPFASPCFATPQRPLPSTSAPVVEAVENKSAETLDR